VIEVITLIVVFFFLKKMAQIMGENAGRAQIETNKREKIRNKAEDVKAVKPVETAQVEHQFSDEYISQMQTICNGRYGDMMSRGMAEHPVGEAWLDSIIKGWSNREEEVAAYWEHGLAMRDIVNEYDYQQAIVDEYEREKAIDSFGEFVACTLVEVEKEKALMEMVEDIRKSGNDRFQITKNLGIDFFFDWESILNKSYETTADRVVAYVECIQDMTDSINSAREIVQEGKEAKERELALKQLMEEQKADAASVQYAGDDWEYDDGSYKTLDFK